jgi:putative membrane protein
MRRTHVQRNAHAENSTRRSASVNPASATAYPPPRPYADGMLVIATVVATLAAVLHILIFVMESVRWTTPATWKRFRIESQEVAEVTRPLAYNQGFYNLFLALGVFLGLILLGIGDEFAGIVLLFFTLGSMVAASVVLITTGAKYIGPALVQGILPLAAIVLLVVR